MEKEQSSFWRFAAVVVLVLVFVGSLLALIIRHNNAKQVKNEIWEKSLPEGELERITELMKQVSEGTYGDMLLMDDGSVIALWNVQLLNQERGYGGGQPINICKGTNYECDKGSRYKGEWNRRDFSLVEKFVKKNPDDPEWNRLVGKFLLQ